MKHYTSTKRISNSRSVKTSKLWWLQKCCFFVECVLMFYSILAFFVGLVLLQAQSTWNGYAPNIYRVLVQSCEQLHSYILIYFFFSFRLKKDLSWSIIWYPKQHSNVIWSYFQIRVGNDCLVQWNAPLPMFEGEQMKSASSVTLNPQIGWFIHICELYRDLNRYAPHFNPNHIWILSYSEEKCVTCNNKSLAQTINIYGNYIEILTDFDDFQ